MTTMRFKDLDAYRVWEAERLSEWSKPKPDTEDKEIADPGPESHLQAKIEKWAKSKGYPCWHDRSRKKNQPGWPDVILFLKDRVILIELKSQKGRLSTEQKILRQQFIYLGHEWQEVRSYKKFLEVLRISS